MSLQGLSDAIVAAQQWGSVTQAPTAGSASKDGFEPVARIDLPRQYAQCWRVECAAPVLATGGEGATPTVGASTRSCEMQVRWGMGSGVPQMARCDYPSAGGGFYVSGSYVEISIRDNTSVRAARYAVHLAPAHRVVLAGLGWPCKTFEHGVVLSGAFATEIAVPRKAYAVMPYSDEIGSLFAVSITWRDGAVTLRRDNVLANAARNLGDITRGLPVPMGATGYHLANSMSGPATLSSRFLLDIG